MTELNELDAQHLRLLSLLLHAMPHGDEGLDPSPFRAKHYSEISQINWLETGGYVRKENERYHISLTGLVQLKEQRARDLERNFESLFFELKRHYRHVQGRPVVVDVLASAAGVSSTDAREALYYMVEGQWCSGRSISFFNDPNPTVCAAESILSYETFNDVIVQLRTWQASRIRDRQKQLANALRAIQPDSDEKSLSPNASVRRKPDWFDGLPASQKPLVDEIYIGLSQGLRALPCMGVRAVIDVLCVELLGSDDSFKEKTKKLLAGGHILHADKTALDAVIEAGHASAHRGHFPNQADLMAILDIVEQLLHRQYIRPDLVKNLVTNTPLKPKREN
jgi:Domain of unknown function (DUF4145)